MTPWVMRLLIANVLVFFVTASRPDIGNMLALYPAYILYRPWGVFTYMFVHAGFGHIFFNMVGLFFFGPRLEQQLGGASFLRLYLLSGLGGAAFSFLFAPHSAVVGASGAVFGVLLGFAYFWPRERIYIWAVLPVEARWLVGALAAMALFSGISGSGAGIAHFAHLGGFAAGYVYLRWQRRKYFKQWRPMPTPKAKLEKEAPRGSDGDALRRWKAIRLEDLHEINRSEVARLIQKAADSGVRSLSSEEKAVLDRFAARH